MGQQLYENFIARLDHECQAGSVYFRVTGYILRESLILLEADLLDVCFSLVFGLEDGRGEVVREEELQQRDSLCFLVDFVPDASEFDVVFRNPHADVKEIDADACAGKAFFVPEVRPVLEHYVRSRRITSVYGICKTHGLE